MLNLPVYLYTPAIRVFIDLDNLTNLGVDDMYHGYATIAKGIKNTIRFNFANGEQRSINVQDKSFIFKLYDKALNVKVLEKPLTIVDDTVTARTVSSNQTAVGTTLVFTDITGLAVGQSVIGDAFQKNTTITSITAVSPATNPVSYNVVISKPTLSIVTTTTPITCYSLHKKGATELVLNSADTIGLNAGRYTYSIVRIEPNNELSPVFIDGARSISGNVEVVDSDLSTYRPSSTQKFNKANGFLNGQEYWWTGSFAANRDGLGLGNTREMQVVVNPTTGFNGTLEVWASLENSAPQTIDSMVQFATITSPISELPILFDTLGQHQNFNFFAFAYRATVTGSIDSIHYRS